MGGRKPGSPEWADICLERELSALVILAMTKATAVTTLEEKVFLSLFWQISETY